MAKYRRDPFYFIDIYGWLSISLVFYEEKTIPRLFGFFNPFFGIRRLSWPVLYRVAFDFPRTSLFVEVWCLYWAWKRFKKLAKRS